jgi:hypothetical protein
VTGKQLDDGCADKIKQKGEAHLVYCVVLFWHLLPSLDSHGDTSMKKLLSIVSSSPVFLANRGGYQLCIQRRVSSVPTIPSNAVQLKGSKF